MREKQYLIPCKDQFLHKGWSFYRHIHLPKDPKKQCWLWRGPLNGGTGNYGYIYYDKKKHMAHRFSVELHTQKKIPKGKVISHTCNNPQCVNPYHLEIATQKQNMAHMFKSKRDNIGRKLQPKDVADIRKSKLKGSELAKKYKVSDSTISIIRTGKR